MLAFGCARSGIGYVDPDLVSRTLLESAGAPSSARSAEVAQSPASDQLVTFSFNAFGDSGWADTHVFRPTYRQGFKRAYQRFDPERRLIADLNYINWETSVGNVCNAFWSSPSGSTYAFLTRPEELSDAVATGFNVIGLANNHTYDCLSSPEGNGPLQSYRHIARLKQKLEASSSAALFSGVFQFPESEASSLMMPVSRGKVPVRLISAYVGGDVAHCRHMVCDMAIERYAKSMKSHAGLRVLALHSWDASSHQRLKVILRNWLSRGLVDVAIGSGPHVAESVAVVQTPRGPGVMATSLGNFIHPSLSAQPNNIVLQTTWSFDASLQRLRLDKVGTTTVACDGGACRQGGSRRYLVPGGKVVL